MMGHGWAMGWMWAIWPLVAAAVVLVAVLLVRSGGNARSRGAGHDPPPRSAPSRTRAREILDERYARGDLTDEDYQERLRALGEKTDP